MCDPQFNFPELSINELANGGWLSMETLARINEITAAAAQTFPDDDAAIRRNVERFHRHSSTLRCK
jgi:hypothetical protein